jgi:hypothetical protein
MNKIYNHVKYNWKEDLEGAIYVILIIGAIALALSTIDRIDQHKETATVISIQRLDNAIVRVETADGNLWEFEADLQDNIEIGDKVVVTFKEYENADRYDDAIVDYEVVE